MQAVILCAGRGKRLKPHTNFVPKVLLDYNNKSILEHTLENLKGLVDEVILVVGYRKENIMDYFKDNFAGLKIKYAFQNKQLGTGHAVKCCEKFVKGNFLVLAGDSIYSKRDINEIIKYGKFSVLGDKVEDWRGYGVFIVKDDELKDVVEKPEKFISNIVNKSLYLFDESIFPILKSLKLSERNEYEITDALRELCFKNKVKVFLSKEKVLHFTNEGDLISFIN